MDTRELMIGDKVLVKVLSQIPDTYTVHTWTAEDYLRDLLQVKPIELTAEILEENGFEVETFLSSEWDCGVYFREFPGCVVEPDDAGYTFGTISYWGKQANDGSPEDWGTMYESRIKGLHYVHELQRALRCCELWDLAGKFKI